MNIFKSLIALALVAIFSISAQAGKTDFMTMNEFTLTTSSGKKLHLLSTEKGYLFDNGKNKVTLVVLWEKSCTSCVQWLKDLDWISKQLSGKLNVVAVEISDMSNEAIEKFKAEHKLTYTTVGGKSNVDFVRQAMIKFQFDKSMPFTAILGYQGQTNGITKGISDTEDYQKYLGKIIKHYEK